MEIKVLQMNLSVNSKKKIDKKESIPEDIIMKKNKILFITLLTVLLLSACGSKKSSDNTAEPTEPISQAASEISKETTSDGTLKTTFSDGTIIEQATDGSTKEIKTNGTIVEKATDGTITETKIDGTIILTKTEAPTQAPTEAPTQAPTEAPTQAPTEAPTQAPTEAPDFTYADGSKYFGAGGGGDVLANFMSGYYTKEEAERILHEMFPDVTFHACYGELNAIKDFWHTVGVKATNGKTVASSLSHSEDNLYGGFLYGYKNK
jgi:hypothetical protein